MFKYGKGTYVMRLSVVDKGETTKHMSKREREREREKIKRENEEL